MATIGRGAAVVEFPNKRTLHGHLAYFAWLGVHLTLLSGMRNRIEVLWNWSWSALTHDRAARIIIQPKDDADATPGSLEGANHLRRATTAGS
jgi:NADH dehydrogenase